MQTICNEHAGIFEAISTLKKESAKIAGKVSMNLFMWVIGLIIGGATVAIGYSIGAHNDFEKRINSIDKEIGIVKSQNDSISDILLKIYNKMPDQKKDKDKP